MKIAVCMLVLVFSLVSADLLTMLRKVEHSDAFHKLSDDEQIMVIELISEAEAGQLTQYVHLVGEAKVHAIMQHLPQHEQAQFKQYLHDHMKSEGHNMHHPQ